VEASEIQCSQRTKESMVFVTKSMPTTGRLGLAWPYSLINDESLADRRKTAGRFTRKNWSYCITMSHLFD
jgi:hypothetical protein